eukprot:4909701-Pleurochrysis_carterae.AAC.1
MHANARARAHARARARARARALLPHLRARKFMGQSPLGRTLPPSPTPHVQTHPQTPRQTRSTSFLFLAWLPQQTRGSASPPCAAPAAAPSAP